MKKTNNSETVNEFMNALDHPLKAEMEVVRSIVMKANSKIAERIKWNAPSFFYKEDMMTFNPRAQKHVHLVFHHPAIVKIKSGILEGDYKDRRMVYLQNIKEIKTHKKELENIMNQLIKMIDK